MRRKLTLLVVMLLAVVPGQSQLSPPSAKIPPTAFNQGRDSTTVTEQQPAQDFGPPAPEEPTPMNATQAVDLAVADSERIPPNDRRYVRYLWCPAGQFKSANLTLNVISRGAAPIRALPLAQGRLLRVDVRHFARFFSNSPADYAGVNPDVEEWLRYWEYLKYDPTFNLLVTRDNARFAQGELPNLNKKKIVKKTVEKKVPSAPYRGRDGQVYDYKIEEEEIEEEVDDGKVDFLVLRFNPDYLPALAKLQKLLYSEAPIVLDRYFMARALHTVKVDPVSKDQTAWSVVWGGLYYEFRGIKRSNQEGVSDEDLFLRGFGIDNLQQLFDRLQTDQRTAIFHSGVTGRKRRVDFFNTPSGHAWDVMGVGSITHDIRQEDTDVGTHPLMNLLTFKDNAREDIFVGPNGMHVYAIFDGNGKLLDEAAINVVSDRTIPSPHPPRLQCAMSCIACHEADGSDGWKNIGNDVKKMMSNRRDPLTGRLSLDLDIFSDTTQKDQIGVINRLAGLYAGDFSRGMRRSRDDYAETILKVSGPQGEDQTHIVKTAMSNLTDTTRHYIYDTVTPKQACWELGVKAGADPLETLRQLLLPEPAKVGFAPEDPRIAALKKGIAIPRTDWAFVQSYAASRVARNKK